MIINEDKINNLLNEVFSSKDPNLKSAWAQAMDINESSVDAAFNGMSEDGPSPYSNEGIELFIEDLDLDTILDYLVECRDLLSREHYMFEHNDFYADLLTEQEVQTLDWDINYLKFICENIEDAELEDGIFSELSEEILDEIFGFGKKSARAELAKKRVHKIGRRKLGMPKGSTRSSLGQAKDRKNVRGAFFNKSTSEPTSEPKSEPTSEPKSETKPATTRKEPAVITVKDKKNPGKQRVATGDEAAEAHQKMDALKARLKAKQAAKARGGATGGGLGSDAISSQERQEREAVARKARLRRGGAQGGEAPIRRGKGKEEHVGRKGGDPTMRPKRKKKRGDAPKVPAAAPASKEADAGMADWTTYTNIIVENRLESLRRSLL